MRALVLAELGLVKAWVSVGAVAPETAEVLAVAWAPPQGAALSETLDLSVSFLAESSLAGGNPVIPLVPALKRAAPPAHRQWVHRGATSQDILDTALMLVARRAVDAIGDSLFVAETALSEFATENRGVVAAGRTLGQHAVPTTVGLRASVWLGGIRRARTRLQQLILPAQLGGAGGTRASFAEIGGTASAELPARFAEELGLDDAGSVWHTNRWPVTELADALVQTMDALGKLGGDIVTLSRPEIAEISSGPGGVSSAMPQKSNPVAAILLRSAALRAPQLGATLHLCAALAEDERPAGAWHAEWPTLRELLRLALGVSAHAAQLTTALRVDRDAVTRNLEVSRGLILAERLSLVLTPLIGAERVSELVSAAAAGSDLIDLVRRLPEAAGLDTHALLDPANYLGDADAAVDRAARDLS